MTGWHTGALAAFDLETTGVDTDTDRIVTACVARVDGSGKDRTAVARWLADPGIPIPDGATRIHGVTTERARAEGQQAEEVVAEVTAMLVRAANAGVPVVGFNVVFDLTLLDRECRRYGLPTLVDLAGERLTVVCARVLDKHVDYRRGPRRLGDVCEYWGVRLDSAHEAAADAVAAAQLVVRIAEKKPKIAARTLPELHAAQVEWHRDQCESYADYLRGQAARTSSTDAQLDLHARADRVAAEAGHWPVAPFEQQGQLA